MAGSNDGGESRGEHSHHHRAVIWQRLRWVIAQRMLDGRRAGAEELATELGEPRGWIAYHLRVLARCRVLKAVSQCNPATPRYRWGPDAGWARDIVQEERKDP